MRRNNLFSAHASLLSTTRDLTEGFQNSSQNHLMHFDYILCILYGYYFSGFSCSYISVSHNSPTIRQRQSEEVESNCSGVLCCVPVVQPLLQVLEVPSFLGSPEGENRGNVECTHAWLYSTVCTVFFVLHSM